MRNLRKEYAVTELMKIANVLWDIQMANSEDLLC